MDIRRRPEPFSEPKRRAADDDDPKNTPSELDAALRGGAATSWLRSRPKRRAPPLVDMDKLPAAVASAAAAAGATQLLEAVGELDDGLLMLAAASSFGLAVCRVLYGE